MPGRRIRAAVVVLGLLGSTGCTVPVKSADPAISAVASSGAVAEPAAVEPGTLVVTVPGLADLVGPSASAPPSAPPSATTPTTGPAAPSTTAGKSTAPSVGASSAPSSVVAPSAPPATGATVALQVAGCPACTVLASHRGVVPGFSAALISVGGRVALMSLRADGSLGAATNVVNGSTFPSPPGRMLPCDLGGRCLVISLNASGTAVVSAFALGPNGRWTAVGDGSGFPSSTGAAVTLDLDGDTGFAIQDTANGQTVWTVYAWKDDTFAPIGCSADGKQPDIDRLSMDRCLS